MNFRVKPFWSPLFTRCLIGCASLLLSCVTYAQTIPDAPTNLAVSATVPFQINLSWADASTNEDGFKVERSLDGTNFTQIAQTLSNATQYLNTSLFPSKTYFYRVRAFNAGGDSAFAGVASTNTLVLCPTSAVGWGYNNYGQTTPPAGLAGLVAISGSLYQSLALKGEGNVVGWGYNAYGQAPLSGGPGGLVAIAAGAYHGLGLRTDGLVIGWGNNYYGQYSVPANATNLVAVAAGYFHSLALRSDGTVVSWGYNNDGETNVPPGLTGVVAIAAGYFHSLALKSDGTVVGWGNNGNGQTNVPPGLTGVVAIAAGAYHSLALKSDGSVVGWGYNVYGQAPPSGGPTGVVAIAAGGLHSLGLESDGTVIGFGYDGDGEATPPADLAGAVAIGAGSYHSVALTIAPSSPSALAATAISGTQVGLTWTDNSVTETGFKVERALDSGGNPGIWTQIVTVVSNVTSYADAGLTTNTTYWYRVRAAGCADSVSSPQVMVTVAPPPAPLGLTATVAGPSQIALVWANSYADVNSFKIERAFDSAGSPGAWSELATVSPTTTNFNDTTVIVGTTYWYRVRANNLLGFSPYSNQVSAEIVSGVPITILDDTFANGTRNVQDLPTRSAWWTSSNGNGPLSASVGSMTFGVPNNSSAMIITYFTPDTNSPPVLVNVGETLIATIHFVFDGIPTPISSTGFKFGLFNFADSTLNPKRVSADGSFSTSSQGSGVQGYALFGKVYTRFLDTNPMDIRKRTNVSDVSLLGASGDWTTLASGPGDTNGFGGFDDLTPYSLQFVFQRTNLNTMVITETWSNMASGATLSVTTNDDSAANFSFDGIAYRPQNNVQAPTNNVFNEVKVTLTPSPVAPAIVTQPQDASIISGQDVTFTVVPNGSLPLLYQWYFNTNTPVANATNAALTIAAAQPEDAGSYSVIVSNSYGSVTSVVAQLTVSVAPPTIITQPQDLTVIPGQSASFDVTVVGSQPFSYQWYYNTNSLLTNATASTLTLSNVQAIDAGNYSVIISNPIGTATSSNAALTVNTGPVAPLFITQPISITVLPGNDASFTTFALGTQPITYQWNRNSVPLLGATSTTLNLLNVQLPVAGNYTVTASNSVGSTVSTTAVLIVSVRMPPPLPVIPSNQFNIINFGASGDGVLNNATAIQDTIAAAALAGGGTVEIPANGTLSTYLSGPIVLSNNVNLQVDSGATLKMLPRADWPGALPPFITANNRHDVAITGSGTIDGNAGFGAPDWWPNLDTAHRPDFINFDGSCSNILVQGVTLRNPPAFHLMLKGNNVGVTIQNVTINTDPASPNTDGMDLASTNVLVQNCSISCGDDNIEIGGSGGPAADVTVSNCTFGTGHGVSIGSITSGKVHDLLVSNCTFNGTDYGIRMKSDRTIGGVVENLKYYDISMTNVGYPIVIYSYYNEFGTPNNITPATVIANGPQSVIDTTPIWRNIIISNLTATGTTGSRIGGIIWGRAEMVVSNLTLNSVNILAPTNTFNIYNARGIQIIDSNLTAPNTSTNTLNLYNTEVTITNSVVSTNLVTLGGLATPPTNNVVDFFNATAAVTDTNVLGPVPVTLGGGTLRLIGPLSFSNNLTVVSASTLVLDGGNNTFGALDGPGPLSVILTNGGNLRLDQGTDMWGVNGAFDTGASGTINNHAVGDITIVLGALSGGPGSMLRGSDQSGPGLDTYVVGGLNSNTTFAGTITDGTSGGTPHAVALTQIGSGTFTLTGASTYSSGTTVSNGTLLVNNVAGSGTGSGALTIVSGATLGGTGAIGGPVTMIGTLAPGNSPGTLTINNSLVVDSAAVLEYELGTNSDQTAVSGNLILGGTLNITDAGGFTNGQYTLFTYGGTLTYNGLTIGSIPNTNFTYMVDLNTPGQVKLQVIPPPSIINIAAANLQDGVGSLAPSSTVVVLVADTGNNGFVEPQSSFPLTVGAAWGPDEKVVGLWDLRDSVDCSGNEGGSLCGQTAVIYTNGIAEGQKLQLYWFPTLTLASNTLGVTSYGKYTDTNNPALDGSDLWQIPAGGTSVFLVFFTASYGSNPDSAGQATFSTTAGLTAFENWQIQYFGDTNYAAAAANADPDGDGMDNNAEFLSGTDPTNSASAFRVMAVARESNNLRVIWLMGSGKTNALQSTIGATGNGSYATNNFSDIFTVTNTVGSVTNYLDVGAATNAPARYYRVRLVP